MKKAQARIVSSFVSCILCLVSVLPSIALAQPQQQDQLQNQLIQSTTDVPLALSMRGITFNNATREVTFDVLLQNNTDDFVDSINYRIEFFAGDALAKEGLLFSTVDFVYAATGALDRISPKDQYRKNIVFIVPETIPGGNYFFRVFAHTDDDSYFGATFTREPTRLTGTGTFLPRLQAALIHPETKAPHPLMEGPLLDLGSVPFVAIMRSLNQDAFAQFDAKPNEYFISYTITHINEPADVLVQVDKKPLKDFLGTDNAGNEAIEIPFAPWSNQQPGAHTVQMTITDTRGNIVSDTMRVRLLYKGLLGRIASAESGINTYRRGEPVDIQANIVAAGDETVEKLLLIAQLRSTSGEIFEYQKDVPLNKTFEGIDSMISFDDFNVKKSFVVDAITLELKTVSGDVIDTHVVTMDPATTFAYPQSFTVLFIILGVLLVIAGGIFFLHKNKKIKLPWLVLCVVIIAGASFVFPGPMTPVAYAQYCGDGSIDDSEECDGSNVGSQTCQTRGYDFGTLGCTSSCTFDVSSCSASVSGCTDSSANNYNPSATVDDGSCQYDVRGCTDSSANNYNPSATVDDGSCQYERMGCTNPEAVNYDDTATRDDGSCRFDGCMDPISPSYNPKATISNPVACNYRQLYGDMLKIWRDPGFPSGYQGMCTTECKPMTFWVKLQCKQCGNEVLSLTIRYINNRAKRSMPTGYHDREYTVTTDVNDPAVYDYGYVTVQKEIEKPLYAQSGNKLNPVPIGALTGTPINANDIINWWIYGPFQVDVCPEAEPKCESPDADANGRYTQPYEISAITRFGAGYCELDYEGTGGSGQAIAYLQDSVSCDMPACLEGIFFKDENQDGVQQISELFLKSPGASSSLPGTTVDIKGAVEKDQFGFLERYLTSIWNSLGRPAFKVEKLEAGRYRAVLDDSSTGWVQTTNKTWRDIRANQRVRELIGVVAGYPVTLSCGVYSGGSMCGDGIIGGSEQCDGSNLNDVSCQIRGYEGGTMSCNSDCSFNTTGCANSPTITSATPAVTSQSTITAGGEVTANGGSTVTARGVVWSTTANPTIALTTKTSDGSGNGTFTSSISGLTCGTTYNIRAYATNAIGTSYGVNQTVTTTSCVAPTVTSATPVVTSRSTITAGGEVTANGGSTVTARGVVWSTTANPTIALTTKTSDGSGNGTFTSSISGLTCGTTYNIRAYATNAIGTSYGVNQVVTPQCTAPVVTTGVPVLLPNTNSTYRFSASIDDTGGSTVTTSGVVWSTNPAPVYTLSTKSSPISSLSSSSTTLACGFTYYVRAYAVNAVGVGYGAEQTITPQCVAPTITSATPAVTSQSTITAGGEVTANGGSTVTARGVVWSTTANPTIALTTKTSDGSGNGTFTSSISGLTCGTTYNIRAYATNAIGTSYGVNQVVTPLCNVLPTVTTPKVGGMTKSAVTFSANQTAIGIDNGVSGTVTARGVCFSANQNPTYSTNGSCTIQTPSQFLPVLNNGTFETTMFTTFTPGVTYYYRAYVTNNAGTTYTTQDTFRVPNVSYVTGAAATGSTITIPTHQVGDLLVMYAYRDGTVTIPTLPTGWTNIDFGSSNSNNASRLAYRVATVTNTASGTWTNATGLVVHVYRGQKTGNPIGGKVHTGGAGTTITYPAVTLTNQTGSSILAFFAGHQSIDTTLNAVPGGYPLTTPGYMVNRTNAVNATNEVNGNDTHGGVKTWSNTTVNVGGSSGSWRTHAIEILSP